MVLFTACLSNENWSADTPLDEPFDLPFSGTINIVDEGLTINFTGIVEDSRCPADVVCVWEGTVVVELMLTLDHATKAVVQLSTAWMSPAHQFSIDTLGFQVTLLDVYPASAPHDEHIPNHEYIARLEVTRYLQEDLLNGANESLTPQYAEIFQHSGGDYDMQLSAVKFDSWHSLGSAYPWYGRLAPVPQSEINRVP